MKLPDHVDIVKQHLREACDDLSYHARHQRLVRLAWDALIAFLIVFLLVWVCT